MFTERFNRIMDSLGLSNTRMASSCGLSRTYIAKFRAGTRVPTLSSAAFDKLICGFCNYAEETDQIPVLFQLIEVDEVKVDSPDLSAALRIYLGEGLKDDYSERKTTIQPNTVSVFSERLDACMNLCGLSNARLSKIMNVDASLISRYRSGSRNPQSSSDLVQSMITILYQRICAVNKKKELAKLAEIQEDVLDEQQFAKWLFSYAEQNKEMIGLVNKMVTSITAPVQQEEVNTDSHGILDDVSDIDTSQDTYIGLAGLKLALKRFLHTCIEEDSGEIWIYSDQDLSWIASESDYIQALNYLIAECVKKQIKIHIIHDIKDNAETIMNTVISLLPLYVSGVIDSFYCSNHGRGLFSHSLFLYSNKACIESFQVLGNETTGLYHYLTEPAELSAVENSFKKLVTIAEPLIRVSNGSTTDIDEGKYIILPDMIFANTGEAGENQLVGYHLDTNPFGNVRIIVEDRYVILTRLTEHPITYTITHPILCHAFQVYVQSLIG